jgi:hypothetical protein
MAVKPFSKIRFSQRLAENNAHKNYRIRIFCITVLRCSVDQGTQYSYANQSINTSLQLGLGVPKRKNISFSSMAKCIIGLLFVSL